MAFLQRMSDKAKGLGDRAKDLTAIAKDIRKKSSSLLETARVKHELSKVEKEMENNLAGLGLLVFQQYNGEEGLQPEIDRLLEATKELAIEAEALEKQINELQVKAIVCPECQKEIPEGGTYCSFCGLKVEGQGNCSE